MKNNINIEKLLHHLKENENMSEVILNVDRLSNEISNEDELTLPLKIISIIGGFFASLTLIGFLALTDLISSEETLIVVGLIMIVSTLIGGFFIKKTIYDITSISIYITGIILFIIGLGYSQVDDTLICWIIVGISMIVIFVNQSFTYSFISMTSIIASLYTLITFKLDFIFLQLFISVLIILLTYTFLHENEILTFSKRTNKLYNSFKIILILSVLTGFSLIQIDDFSDNFYWIVSVTSIIAIVYTLNKVFEILDVNLPNQKLLYSTLVVLILLPTVLSPAVSGSLLIILLCFYANYKTGLVIGLLSLLIFISNFYYSLQITLLTKSIILMITGVLFILIYLFIHKKISTNEKV